MSLQTNQSNIKPSLSRLKIGLALTLAIGLVSVMVSFAFAASAPIITTVAGGRSGSWVQVRIDNLPANVDYVVYEGLSGTQGIGGTRIAGFNSVSGGTEYFRFELATEIPVNQPSELRIVGSDGSSAWQTIGLIVPGAPVSTTTAVNVPVTGATATMAPTVAATAGGVSATPVASASPVVPVTGANAITNLTFSNQIEMTRNDFGGTVSFLISNLPLNTDYLVRIGPAGQNGENGYVVAHFFTGDQTTNIATFEVPTLLRDSSRLDLRMEAQNQTLVKTFANTNFPVATNQVVQSK